MSLRSPTLPTLLLPLRKSFLPLSSFYLDHLHQVSSYSSFWFSSVFISFGKPFLNFPVQLSIPFCIQTPGSGFAPLPPLPHCHHNCLHTELFSHPDQKFLGMVCLISITIISSILPGEVMVLSGCLMNESMDQWINKFCRKAWHSFIYQGH